MVAPVIQLTVPPIITPTSERPGAKGHSNTAASGGSSNALPIAAITISCVVGVALLITIIVLVVIYRRNRKPVTLEATYQPPPSPPAKPELAPKTEKPETVSAPPPRCPSVDAAKTARPGAPSDFSTTVVASEKATNIAPTMISDDFQSVLPSTSHSATSSAVTTTTPSAFSTAPSPHSRSRPAAKQQQTQRSTTVSTSPTANPSPRSATILQSVSVQSTAVDRSLKSKTVQVE